MKREQIIEFAKKHIYIEYKKAGFGTYQELGGLEEFADAILALPLDVPSDDEIRYRATLHAGVPSDDPDLYGSSASEVFNECIRIGQWVRDEIIKRNR